MTIDLFRQKKISKEKISMITCYDASFAAIIDKTDIDAVLVGDSLAMVIYGHADTTQATMQMMSLHTKAVRSKLKNKFLISDMPFMSYRKNLTETITNAEKLIRSGANAIKLEGADGNLDCIRHLNESGIPVMGHLGLTPQFINTFGGWKVQGKEQAAKEKMKQDAIRLQSAGCFSIVLECVPSSLASDIQKELNIPCIGIGAGADVDGQVLVLQDLIGLQHEFRPKFVKQYADTAALVGEAIDSYCKEVKNKDFPNAKESYQ